MRRRTFLLALWGAPLLAGAKEQVFNLFTRIAEALSAGDPLVFLGAVDHDLPYFQDLQANLTALVSQAEISSSIEVLSDEGDDQHRVEKLDWFMQIVEKADSQKVTRRREVVGCRLERRGKNWKIVSIEPLDFFAPLKEGNSR